MGFFNYRSDERRDEIDNNLGPRRYSTVLYPKIERSDTDLYIVTKRGERLDTLASHYYGDTRYWKILAQANNIGKNSFAIPEGTRLRIPMGVEELERLFSEYNNSR